MERKTWKPLMKAYLLSAHNNLSFLKMKMLELEISNFDYNDVLLNFGKYQNFLNYRMLWFSIIYDIHHAVELGGKFLLIEIYTFKNPPKNNQDYMTTVLGEIKNNISHDLSKLEKYLRNESIFLHSGLLDTFSRIILRYLKLGSSNDDSMNTFYRFPEVTIGKGQSRDIKHIDNFNQFSVQVIDEYLEEIDIIETLIELLESSIQSNTSNYLKQDESALSSRYMSKGYDMNKLLNHLI